MAFIGFLNKRSLKPVLISCITAPVGLWRRVVRILPDREGKEDQEIEALAQRIIQMSHLLNEKKYIPHGPAYTKLPDFKDLS